MDQLPIELFAIIVMQLATGASFKVFVVSLKALSTTNKVLRQNVTSEYLLGFVVDHYCIPGEGSNREKIESLFTPRSLYLYRYSKCLCGYNGYQCACSYKQQTECTVQRIYSEQELYKKISGIIGRELVWIDLENSKWKILQKIDALNASNKLALLHQCAHIRYAPW